MPTRILSIDTATEACSVALWDRGTVYSQFELCPRAHTERILPLVQTVLTEAGLRLTQLDALAFGRGPGSFTGVRIATAIAQGLALGASLPVIGISTLQTLAQGVYRLTQEKHVLAAIDARMGEIYWGEFELHADGHWQGEKTEALLTPAQALSRAQSLSGIWARSGTGWQTYPSLLAGSMLELRESTTQFPRAEDMLPLALKMWASGEVVSAENAEPAYLRNDVTWKKLPGR